jgi:hypothetical protein
MTLEQRAAELHKLSAAYGGDHRIYAIYIDTCIAYGQVQPAGMLVPHMIQAILDKEFPAAKL